MNTRCSRWGLIAAPGLFGCSSWAVDIRVDTRVDQNDLSCGEGDCSLRNAIAASNDGALNLAERFMGGGSRVGQRNREFSPVLLGRLLTRLNLRVHDR